MHTRLLFAGLALAASAAAMMMAPGCSLGLDESLINKDGGGEAAVDAGIDAPNPVQCSSDPQCTPTNGCLTGHCDTTRNQCVYDLCATTACNAETCDSNTHTCSQPAPYAFHAGSFHVSLGSAGCGGARRCFASIFPFVFVGTTNGVVAYSVANPTNTAPAPIPVAGLPFFPSYIVASGTRIYFVGSVAGAGPDYKLPLAWLDIPTDPTVTQMAASTVFDTMQTSSVEAVFADTTGGIYLVHADSNKSYPAARVTAPLKDLDTLAFSPTTGLPAGSTVVGASGSRLITFRQDNGGAFNAFFSVETSAATASAQNAGEQSIVSTMGQTSQPDYFAQTPTGGLLWSTGSVNAPDGGSVTTASARLTWVLSDQGAPTFDATTRVDVNAYNTPGAGGDLQGPVAWIDDNTALVISATPANTQQSVVQVATRSGSPTIIPNRSFQLAFPPSELAAVASKGFGYVLTPDQTTGVNVHIFGAGCN